MMKIEVDNTLLKDCPFCGGRAKLYSSSFFGKFLMEYEVKCIICHTKAGECWYESVEDAMDRWNYRYHENSNEAHSS